MLTLFDISGNLVGVIVVVDVFFTLDDVVYCIDLYTNGKMYSQIVSSEDLDELEKTYIVKWRE